MGINERELTKFEIFQLAATLTAGQNADMSADASVKRLLEYVVLLKKAEDSYEAIEQSPWKALQEGC